MMNKKHDYVAEYQAEKQENIRRMTEDPNTRVISKSFTNHFVEKYKYGYYSSWMGRPIIQLPQDIVALQEIIMDVKPDLIVETGIAHGGSTVFYASMLELLGDTDIKREIVAIDIEIREHNREAIINHPMYKRITLIESSSTDPETVRRVCGMAQAHQVVMVVLDSNHTHQHVLNELNAFAHLVTPNSYVVVFDTIVEYMAGKQQNRPWGGGEQSLYRCAGIPEKQY